MGLGREGRGDGIGGERRGAREGGSGGLGGTGTNWRGEFGHWEDTWEGLDGHQGKLRGTGGKNRFGSRPLGIRSLGSVVPWGGGRGRGRAVLNDTSHILIGPVASPAYFLSRPLCTIVMRGGQKTFF